MKTVIPYSCCLFFFKQLIVTKQFLAKETGTGEKTYNRLVSFLQCNPVLSIGADIYAVCFQIIFFLCFF